MKNKVESLQGYDLIEANDDVIKLLNGLKELTFKTHKVQYGYWTICQTVRSVLTIRQQDNEPLVAEYYKRFTSCVDVAESQWGTLVLRKAAATNERNENIQSYSITFSIQSYKCIRVLDLSSLYLSSHVRPTSAAKCFGESASSMSPESIKSLSSSDKSRLSSVSSESLGGRKTRFLITLVGVLPYLGCGGGDMEICSFRIVATRQNLVHG
jgi:hypothetical protein